MKTGKETMPISKQASKQVGVNFAFFPVELKTAQKLKAYSVRFTSDGIRLFVFCPKN